MVIGWRVFVHINMDSGYSLPVVPDEYIGLRI